MKRLLFISNGYGEDAVSARVAREFAASRSGYVAAGFPTVGAGKFYEELNIPLAGRGPELPSEGFVRTPGDFMRDVTHGFFSKTRRLGIDLGNASRNYDFLILTGDPYLLLFTSLYARRDRVEKVFIGVQHSEWYGTKKPFKHHYGALERLWLGRHAGLVFVRDRRTEEFLRGKGLGHVACAGNPMMDCIDVSGGRVFPAGRLVIGILPGSKREAYANLEVTFEVVKKLALARHGIAFAFALSKTLSMDRIVERFKLREVPGAARRAPNHGAPGRGGYSIFRIEGCPADLFFSYNLFGDVINEAHAVIGTSGTGNEQAAGMGKPVFAFWGKGPQITKKFLVAQKKLLGPSLFLFPPDPERIARDILRVLGDENVLTAVRENGILRMEGRGSIPLIVDRIVRHIALVETRGR